MVWRRSIVYDDSLSVHWESYTHRSEVYYQQNSSARSSSAATCSSSVHVSLRPGGFLALRTNASLGSSRLSLQLWMRGVSAQFRSRRRCVAAQPRPKCTGDVLCLSLRLSSDAAAAMMPLCALGVIGRDRWRKLTVRASVFSPARDRSFDEIALVAAPRGLAATEAGQPVELLLDELVLLSSAPPPTLSEPPLPETLRPTTPHAKGWCSYLSSEYRREQVRAPDIPLS